MLSKALNQAFSVSVGLTIGGVLLPRLLGEWGYNISYPPLALHLPMYFAASYIVCFITAWPILFLKSAYRRSLKQDAGKSRMD